MAGRMGCRQRFLACSLAGLAIAAGGGSPQGPIWAAPLPAGSNVLQEADQRFHPIWSSRGMVASQEAIAALTPMQRDVFLLRIQEGQSYRDLAQVLGTTEGAARVHYHNAMRTVQEILNA